MEYNFNLNESKGNYSMAVRITTNIDELQVEISKIYKNIINYMTEIGAQPMNIIYTCFHNTDVEMLDVEVGFLVQNRIEGRGDIIASTIPSGKQVSMILKDVNENKSDVIISMVEWIRENGYTKDGGIYEFYFNSMSLNDKNSLQTKIMIPVK